jgi:ATP-dependent phosphofructokinase / diphosphate-dependent phosphofructokinase
MRIGILTAGGDCPGINAAIRGVAKTAIVNYQMEVFGISSGFQGLLENDYFRMDESHLSGLLTLGGTILGTSREKPFKKSKGKTPNIDKPGLIKKNYNKLKLDCLVCIGGNGTMNTAQLLTEKGLNIIGIPKTIDNDIWGTDFSFGFDSALTIATEAIDRLHTTANSHKRIMVIEVMGHHTGWLALYSGISGGGDVILIPEIGYDIEVVIKYLEKRDNNLKPYTIIVVAEGIDCPKNSSPANYIARKLRKHTDHEIRETILGYIQRGGTPSPMDRILATRFGAHATSLIAEELFGRMVSFKDNNITSLSLSEVAGKLKKVPVDFPLIINARQMGTCFGKE